MHPLMTHIHPALRTAIPAWLLVRGVLWLMHYARGLQLEPTTHRSPGTPLWVGLGEVAAFAGPWSGYVLAGISEALIFAAILSVYHFCRKDTLPQTAERATWLFAVSPLFVMMTPASAWTIAVTLGVIALASALHARYVLASLALAGAIATRPELVVLAPGFSWLAWRSRSPGRTPAWGPWVATLAGPAALIGVIFSGFALAGAGGVSLRTLHPEGWQTQLQALGADQALWGLALAGVILAAVRFWESTPKGWLLLSIPPLCWPLLHAHPSAFSAMGLLCLPAFVYLAKMSEDPTRERPLLIGSVLLSMLLIV